MPDKKRLEDIWAGDLFGRAGDAEYLVEFLLRRLEERRSLGRVASYVLNIDAAYGEGKTFFLGRLYEQLRAEYPAVYVNAWQNDHADTPLLAIISEIEKTLAPHLTQKGLAKAKAALQGVLRNGAQVSAAVARGAATQLAKRLVGEGLETALEAAAGEPAGNDAVAKTDVEAVAAEAAKEIDKLADRFLQRLVDNFRANQRSIEQFRQNVRSLVESIAASEKLKPPLFVLVDELDRCRPDYAVSLLEQVKHLFDVDGVVFIIATDSQQLRAVTSAVYGWSFDSGRYLRRFFDRTYAFPAPDRTLLVQQLFKDTPLPVEANGIMQRPEDSFLGAMDAFDMSLRDIEQCYDLLRVIATAWPYKSRIEMIYMLPLIATFHSNNIGRFDSLAGGKRVDSPKQWMLKYTEYDGFGRALKNIEQDVFTLLERVMHDIAKPLPEINLGGDDQVAMYLRDITSNEFQRIHNNRFTRGNPPMSVLSTYPHLVRSAGRLRRPDDPKPAEHA